MTTLRFVLLLAAGAVCTTPAYSQDKGPFEVSAFGRYTVFSVDRTLDNAIGAGGGIGVFLSSRFKLAVDASVNSEGGYIPLHARIVYEHPLSDRTRVMLGSGWVHNWYDTPTARSIEREFEDGIGSMLGVKFDISNAASLFVQATHDFMPPWLNPREWIVRDTLFTAITITEGSDVHWGAEAGIAFRFGGGREEPAVVAVVPPPPPPPPPPTPTPPVTPPPAQQPPRVPPTMETATPTPPRYATLAPVFFDFDSWEIRADARETLLAAADILRANPEAAITIVGKADERGTDTYNDRLGRRRAGAVMKFLVDNGIAASRLEVVSKGEREPVVEGHDETAWAQNRRVDFRVNGNIQLKLP